MTSYFKIKKAFTFYEGLQIWKMYEKRTKGEQDLFETYESVQGEKGVKNC